MNFGIAEFVCRTSMWKVQEAGTLMDLSLDWGRDVLEIQVRQLSAHTCVMD